MTHRSGARRSNSTPWVALVVGLGVLIAGELMTLLPLAYGQRGAELGTVVLETDKVVVRYYVLLPGMPTGMHSHSRDYLRVIVQGGTLKVTTPWGPSRLEKVETGAVTWRTETWHDSKNVGDSPIEALLIEFK